MNPSRGIISFLLPRNKAISATPVAAQIAMLCKNNSMVVSWKMSAKISGIDSVIANITKTPPNTYFLLKAAKIEKGSTTPGKGPVVGRVSKSQLAEIAKVKMKDMNCTSIDSAVRQLAGSARAMGMTVVEG
ncbi:MAG: 50S ribosomal protein L11 [Betaproteobacteria bacterium]|nr:50S ribosomal protein L11 [Betaproteobacteria bacterium]